MVIIYLFVIMEKCIKGIGKMKKNKKTIQYIPYQLCPKCNGNGKILINNWYGSPTSISSGFETCNLCHGAMVIPMYIDELYKRDKPDLVEELRLRKYFAEIKNNIKLLNK